MFGIIVNPVSGAGKNAALSERVLDALAGRGIVARMYETRMEGDGEEQARQAIADGCEAVVCIGGDGTLSEVVRAMAGSGVLLYIVPGGTGNDFARAFGLPKDSIRALEVQLDGKKASIDCGSVNGRPFLNVSGSGFDVEVLRKMEEFRTVYPGGKAYRKAVIAVLNSYKAFEAEVTVDDGKPYPVRCTIVEVANGRCIGGGMRVAPAADYQDGLFDVVTVDRVPSKLIPLLLPLFILGIHVYLPIARVVRARRVTMRSKGMTVNIDGRLEEMDEARFEILPGALTVMIPAK